MMATPCGRWLVKFKCGAGFKKERKTTEAKVLASKAALIQDHGAIELRASELRLLWIPLRFR